MHHFSRIPKIMLCVSAIVMLAACGGSSSDSDKDNAAANRGVSGTAAKGIVSNAIVTAYELKGFDGTAWEKSQISITTTDQNGKYSLPIANTTGPILVVLKADGGNTLITCDIADCGNGVKFGGKYAASANFELRAIYNIEPGTTKISLPITPLTTIAENNARLHQGNYPGLAIAAAIGMGNSFVTKVFSLNKTPTSTQPIDITTAKEEGSSDALQQSIINAAFLAQLGNSDLEDMLDSFSQREITRQSLQTFINNVRSVATTIIDENENLKAAAESFMASAKIPAWETEVGECEQFCTYIIPLPTAIQTNLDKAKALVSNARGLIAQLKDIVSPPAPLNPGDPVEVSIFRSAAQQLQEGAGPIADALGHSITFLEYYREAVLNSELDNLPVDADLLAITTAVCELLEASSPRRFQDCSKAAQHFVTENNNVGVITREGTTWSLSNFGFKHTYIENTYDAQSNMWIEEEKECSETFENSISIDLPDGIRMADVKFNQGKVTASIQGKMNYESCPEGTEPPVLSALLLSEGATLTIDSRSVHGSLTHEGPDFNSIELNTTNANLSAGSANFVGNLALKAVRSQNFANLSPNNEMGSMIPKSLNLDGTFTADDSSVFTATISVLFRNAETFSFIDHDSKNYDLATYRYEAEGDEGKPQLVITVRPPNSSAYSYAIRTPEIILQDCFDWWCNGIEVVRFSDTNTAGLPLSVRHTEINAYDVKVDAIDEQECSQSEQHTWWHDGACWSNISTTGGEREIISEEMSLEDCTVLAETYYAYYDYNAGVCTKEIVVLNPNFQLLELFNPALPSSYHVTWSLLGGVDHIPTEDGRYKFYSDRNPEELLGILYGAKNNAIDQKMPLYMSDSNPDVNKPNRYLKAWLELKANGQNISDSLPLVNLTLTLNRTGYRDGSLELHLDWQEEQQEHVMNINIAAKNDKVTKATMDDGDGTTFNLIYNRFENIRGTVEKDGTIYGTVKKENGLPMVSWLDKVFESLY